MCQLLVLELLLKVPFPHCFPYAALASSGGVVPYHAPGVHFDGLTSLRIANLTATDSANLGIAFWFKSHDFITSPILFVVDPAGDYLSFIEWIAGNGNTATFSATKTNALEYVNALTVSAPSIDAWHSCICAANSTTGDIKIYVDRVDVTNIPGAAGLPFIIPFNGLPLWIGDDGFDDVLIADIADLRIAPNQNWLTVGDISPTTLDLFTTALNKPVNPAIATAALGTPAVLFSGNAAAFGTNQGNGGTFSTTGTLTNAATSPSD